MYHLNLSRTDFVSLMGGQQSERSSISGPIRNGIPQQPPASSELYAFWEEEIQVAGKLPVLVVVRDEELNDFLAWAVTFLPSFRPLTCFFRIISWTLFLIVQNRTRDKALDRHGPALIGMILGEALANATSRGFIDSLPLTAFESTFSWVMSRALAVGLDPKALTYVTKGWNVMRDLAGQSSRRISAEPLEAVWSVVLQLATNDDAGFAARGNPLSIIAEACKEIRRSGRISSFNWDRLSGGRISNSAVADAMSSTKERRVETFEKVVEELQVTRAEKLSTSFLVGYLASLVSTGSLEHTQLILPLQTEFPSSMLWYGLCTGLLPDRCILADYNHLGLRLLRLLECKTELATAPHCDISLSELEVILRGEPRSRSFRQGHSSSLRVEVVPLVTSVIRAPGRTTPGYSDQLGLFGAEERPSPVEFDRLGQLVANLRSTLSLAEALLSSKGEFAANRGTPGRGRRRR